MDKGPDSGFISTSVPGVLINQVQFIHVPVVLHFSSWNIVEFSYYKNIKVASFFSVVLVDKITIYQQ